jgi:hypothetical protein
MKLIYKLTLYIDGEVELTENDKDDIGYKIMECIPSALTDDVFINSMEIEAEAVKD